jgi:hypothetical protein
MDAEKVVKHVFEAFEAGKFEDAASHMADDMVFSGPVPEPIGKKEFIALQSSLIKAIPDWKFNAHNLQIQGNTVHMLIQISGTHTQPMPPLMPGMPAFPATGKHVSLPEEPLRITFQGDKVTRVEADVVPGGGVGGVLQQLGIQMHA